MSDTRKTSTGLSAVLVSLALAGGPVLAQDDAIIPEQDSRQLLTENLIGMPVYGQSQETDGRDKIGDVASLLLNEENRVTGVVVSFGGFLGFGAKSVAIDWDALEIEQFGQSGYAATVGMTRAEIEEAPAFKTLAQKEAERAEQQMREQQRMQQQQMQEQGTGVTGTGTGTGTGTTQ